MTKWFNQIRGNEFLRTRRIFVTILLGVIVLHLLAAAMFGSAVVFQQILKREAVFVAEAPRTAKLEPRKLEYKVKMQEQQRRSGRPTYQPRISSSRVSEINMPDVKVDIAPIKDKIQASMKTVGTAGRGTGGFGSGAGTGAGSGLGLGMSKVQLFGLNTAAERIAVLVDVSQSMVEDEKGGVDGFTALKGEIAKVIKALSPGSFFTVIFFGATVDVMQPELVIANNANKEAAIEFLKAYYPDPMSPTQSGLGQNYSPHKTLESPGGLTRHDLAVSAAIEMNADAIFLISDGSPWIYRPWAPGEEERALAAQPKMSDLALAKLQEANAKQIAEETERRAKRGLPPKAVEGGRGGYGISQPRYSNRDVLEFVDKLAQEAVEADPKKAKPRIYCFGYSTTPQQEAFMRDLSVKFKGRFKKFRPLVRPIKEN